MKTPAKARLALAMLVVATLLCATAGQAAPPAEATMSAIVQATDPATATRLVGTVGAAVTHELGIIRAVGARLTANQRDRLAGLQGVLRLYENGPVLVDAVDDQIFTQTKPGWTSSGGSRHSRSARDRARRTQP